jgi:hypothetical protein
MADAALANTGAAPATPSLFDESFVPIGWLAAAATVSDRTFGPAPRWQAPS